MSSSTFCFLIVAALIAQIVISAPVADKTVYVFNLFGNLGRHFEKQ